MSETPSPQEPAPSSAFDGRGVLFALVLAFGITRACHLWVGDLYLNLRDEGYLWYGVEAVRQGQVPLLDFQAYDPGRYYWCELFAPLFGESIVGVRGAVALFQGLGLFFGLLAARRVLSDRWLPLLALLLVFWSFPRFKLFESALTLMGVWAACRTLERPRPRRFFVLGLVVGLAAFFGRNHGVYLGVASLAATALLLLRRGLPDPLRSVGALGAGTLVGYAPMLGMLATVPGYPAAFWEAIVSILERGANLPKPFPWSSGPALEEHGAWGGGVLQLGFYLPVLFLPLGLWQLLRTERERLQEHALLLAAVLVGGVYVHHYSVRADLPHLAQAIFPVLLLGVALAPRRWRAPALVLLTLHGGALALRHHPVLRHFDPARETPALAVYEHDGAELRLKAGLTRHLKRVQGMIEQAVPAEDALFVAPTRPTFYPLFDKLSPTWWIYFLWPATEEEQRETIERLRDVRWALIVEKSFADDEAYDFRNTNPLVWEHLSTEWKRLEAGIVPEDYYLFRRP